MASSILQGGLLNTTKEDGVLSESSRSSVPRMHTRQFLISI
jgi:hypothetical protein